MRLLIAAYTVLAIAAGARAGVQLAIHPADAPVPYALSAVAAVVYLTLAIALRKRVAPRWRKVAQIAAIAELVGVLCVGTAERLSSTPWPDQTVWSGYGAGYGWMPLVLPVAALIMLNRRA